jgi:hypothetical protein
MTTNDGDETLADACERVAEQVRISRYGNATRAAGFMLPPPYELAGRVLRGTDPDVAAICEVAIRRGIAVAFQPSLVMRLDALWVQQYVTFTEADGEHKFYEASGDRRLFGPGDLKEYLEYLETIGPRLQNQGQTPNRSPFAPIHSQATLPPMQPLEGQ